MIAWQFHTSQKCTTPCNLSRWQNGPRNAHAVPAIDIGEANGRLVLPPQNQALVSVLMGGLVKDITVQEGEFVEQGKSLASLETISSTPSSATPSLSINKSNL